MSKVKVSINGAGEITRNEDQKHLATVIDGEVKYENPAYAKGDYKEAILAVAVDFEPSEEPEATEATDEVEASDARIPTTPPERDSVLGSFSPAWINYDHENLDDEAFGKKYRKTAQCQLDFMSRKPHLFADREGLEERFATLATA